MSDVLQDVRALLFDLGGVIVPWVGFSTIADDTGLAVEDVKARFQMDPILSAYEVGTVRDEIFIERLSHLFGYEDGFETVARTWCDWVHPPFPDVISMVNTLSSQFRVACLSNTNALHWDHLYGLFDVDGTFDPPMASHLLGLAKPDPEIYKVAAARLGLPAHEILFFDDTPANVAAAQEVGFKAQYVDPARGVGPVLKRLGLVS